MRRSPLRRLAGIILLTLACPPAFALAFDLPQPWRLAIRHEEPSASYRLPLAPWADEGLTVRVLEGAVSRTAWQRPLEGASTLDLLAPLRAGLEAEGFRPLFDCETEGCGGFDFRFATEVLSEPEMHVDLGDFRFLAALRDTPQGPEAVSLMVSRSAATGFVQMVRVTPRGAPPPAPLAPSEPAASPAPEAPPPEALAPRLEAGLPVVLEDLVFASGSAQLEEHTYPAVAELAEWLKADPARRVVIVGHTDAAGSLAANVAVSRARAAAVRDRLVTRHGVPAAQVGAEGVGYLSPRDTNRTDEGRARNRRVEVVPEAG